MSPFKQARDVVLLVALAALAGLAAVAAVGCTTPAAPPAQSATPAAKSATAHFQKDIQTQLQARDVQPRSTLTG